jgi:hypothetical protein
MLGVDGQVRRGDHRRHAPGDDRRADNAPGARDRACLIVIRGLNVGGDVQARGQAEMVLGRGQQVDVEILDDGISRRHAALRFRDDQVLLEDLGSRNGTFVNGQRVEGSRPIQDGDKIQLSSSTILKFTYADRLDESFQRRMYESSLRDGLTKSFNRKYFLDRLEREFRFAKRHRQPLALIMLDIDEFKKLNDSAATSRVTGCSPISPPRSTPPSAARTCSRATAARSSPWSAAPPTSPEPRSSASGCAPPSRRAASSTRTSR